jgi:glycosyltransferase involved in cell wall biosynthesis
MAVQILTHEYLPYRGGIAYYVDELGRACAAARIKTEIWAPGYGVRGWEEDGWLRINRLAMNASQSILNRLRMRSALKKERPGGLDTVVLADPGPIRLWMWGKIAGLPPQKRMVIILHGTELRVLGMGLKRQRFGRLLEAADVVGVVSEAVQTELRQRYPNLSTHVVQVPGAVRSQWRGLEAERRPRSGAQLNVLHVGRFSPRKGQDLIVEAVSQLTAQEQQQIEVHCVGSIKKREFFNKLQDRIRERNLPIRLISGLTDAQLLDAYRWADVMLFPSREYGNSIEGLGLAAIEASHFGLPVIATRTGGVAQAVRDGSTGILVEPEPEALREAIGEFIRCPDRFVELGQAGAAYVRTNFSWAQNAQGLGLLDT